MRFSASALTAALSVGPLLLAASASQAAYYGNYAGA
jgi:hypothetical protein